MDLEFILKAHGLGSRLKRLKRSGWVERGVDDPETVAGHSYAVALLSILVAELRGLDPLEAARIALIHDLPEAILGDLTPKQKKLVKGLRERELEVIKDLAKSMPEEISSKYLEAWMRYSDKSDPVAKLVRDLDKLEMGLQALEYAKAGYEKALEIYRSALEQIEDQELRSILEEAGRELA